MVILSLHFKSLLRYSQMESKLCAGVVLLKISSSEIRQITNLLFLAQRSLLCGLSTQSRDKLSMKQCKQAQWLEIILA